MKRKLLFMIFSILLFPSIVFAKDTCNSNDIKIEEISIEGQEGYTEELTPVNIDDNKINLNIEMYNVGESITYKIKVKNNSNNDYYFTKDSFNLNTDYIEYSLLNNSEVIKSNEEKSIELKITYKKQIPEDSYNENNMMAITLANAPIGNPDTKATLFAFVLLSQMTLALILMVIQKNRYRKIRMIIFLIISCVIPISIKALCTINLEINANITINEKEAIFLPGKEVNAKIKILSGDNVTLDNAYYFNNENITAIKQSLTEPIEQKKQAENIVSTQDSPYPIYMWYEEGTIYWWSESPHPKLNKDASYMFTYMKELSDISSVKEFDLSNTIDISYMFTKTESLDSVLALKNWDTSNIISMKEVFSNSQLNDLAPLKNWDTSKVQNMEQIFYGNNLTSLNGLENWNTSNLLDLSSSFAGMNTLTSIEALKNWDTKNVVDLGQTFAGTNIDDLEALKDWDTRNVEIMCNCFQKTKITNLNDLSNWDTSKVTTMASMFSATPLENLNGLENWDVSNVLIFSRMFSGISAVDANSINDWNINSSANFDNMFLGVATHPEFNKVPGTWNAIGTFIPN